jgi:putative ABC transport system permease protein
MIEQAGVALAAAGLSVAAIPASFPLLSAAAGPLLPRSLGAGPDASTIGVTLGLGFLASALFALPAALYVSRLPTSSMVGLFSVRWGPTASAPRSGTGPPLGGRLRRTLAIAQLALSLALLIGSALIAMTLLHLGRVPLGFRAERLLVLRLALGDRYQDEARRIAYFRELQERLRSLPSVRSAGAATVIPMSSFGIDFDVPYYVPGAPEPERARAPKARFRSVTPGGLEALGTARLEGRGFTWEDDGESPRVIIVNRALAQRIWGNESPLGKELRFFWADWQRYEVVGVVEDSRSDRLTREAPPQLFVPYAQYPYLVMNVVVESSGNPEMLAETAREAVLEVDPLQPVNGSSTMVDLLAASTSRERLAAFLLGALASAALFLSLLGIYATLSFSMERRKREIGIRAALGASPRALLKWALEEGATATLAGIGLGLIISAATTDRLSDLLFGVGARDPWTFVAATAFLFATSMLSCYFAVRRTLSIDPALAIRAD